jgi:DNA-binding NtrC family response regulator
VTRALCSSAEIGHKPPRITDTTTPKLTRYPWPGNVGELRNVLERAMLVSNGSEIRTEDLFLEDSHGEVAAGGVLPQREWEVRPLAEITTAYVRAAVEAVGGNVRRASRMLQISPSTLYAELRETPNAE